MKKVILFFLLAINITPAHANEIGGWVKVNANGTIISGTSLCTPDVCGDVNSSFSQLTLLPGERWVQITNVDENKNVTGPNVLAETKNNEKITGKVDPVTNVATITKTIIEPLAPGVNAVKETETVFSTGQVKPVSTEKKPVVVIEEPETIKEDPVFIEWLNLIHLMFLDLFSNFTWAWDL